MWVGLAITGQLGRGRALVGEMMRVGEAGGDDQIRAWGSPNTPLCSPCGEWQRGLDDAGRTGTRYSLATTHLEVGVRTDDPQHLESAQRIFSEMGVDGPVRGPARRSGS